MPSITPDAALLTDRVAIVTGAARGIGEATALALARFGAHVAVVDRLGDELDETVAAVEALGRRCLPIVGDVRDDAVVDAVVEATMSGFGRLDVLVNNAGGGFWAPFVDVTPKGQAVLMAENYGQVVSCIRAAVPHMVNGGSVINVTSIEAHRAGPGFAVYSSMKAAVANLSKSLALEFADRRIRVNCIAPDMIPTPGDEDLQRVSGAMGGGLIGDGDGDGPSQPWPDTGTPDDCAAAAVFLAGDLSRFVTGSTIHVDGGTFAASGWRRGPDPGSWLL